MTTWLQSLQMHEIVLYGLVFGLPIVAIGFSFIETTIKAFIRHRAAFRTTAIRVLNQPLRGA